MVRRQEYPKQLRQHFFDWFPELVVLKSGKFLMQIRFVHPAHCGFAGLSRKHVRIQQAMGFELGRFKE
jgi:hypothetical protein